MSRVSRHKRYRIKWPRMIASLAIVALLVVILVAGARARNRADVPDPSAANDPVQRQEEPQENPTPKFPEPVSIDIYCLGDLMAHKTQLDAAYDSASGSYSFDECFENVKDITQSADLLLANVETIFKGKGPYTGYPDFNTPDSYAETIVNTLGVDVACFANNHMLDGGMDNLKRSVQLFRDMGVETAGFRFDGEERYTIVEVKGVKIGIVNYCFETPQNGGRRTLQAGILSEEALERINHFGYEDFDGDMAMIGDQIAACKLAGADIVVCYMHWGEEYQRSGNSYQRAIAKKLAGYGADIIFGSHPHVLQEIDCVEVERDGDSTKIVPVYYSLGNFISNQRAETLNNRYTEQGMIAGVNVVWNFEYNKIEMISFGCTPTWVDRYKDNAGKYHYSLVPLGEEYRDNDYYDGLSNLKTSGHTNRVLQAIDDVNALLGSDYVGLWKQKIIYIQ